MVMAIEYDINVQHISQLCQPFSVVIVTADGLRSQAIEIWRTSHGEQVIAIDYPRGP